MKKKMALLLSAVMTAGMLSGAAGGTALASDDDVETVSFYTIAFYSFSQDRIQAVEDAMNEILEERYGVKVDLQYIDGGNWVTQSNLALTTDDCDIITLFNTAYDSFISNNQIIPLNDYYESAGEEFQSIFSDGEIAGVTRNGNIYSLPRKYYAGMEYAVVMNQEICDELGIDPESVDSLEALDEVLHTVHEAYPDIYAIVPQAGSTMVGRWYYGDGVNYDTGTYGVLPYMDSDFDEEDTSTWKFVSIFETERLQELNSYTNKWYQEGLSMADVLSNTMDGSTMIETNQAFCFLNNTNGNGYIDLASNYNNAYVSASLCETYATSSSFTSINWAISSNSKHQDAAWKVLQALYEDEDVVKLLIDGIEGEDCVYNEDGTVSYPEGVTASSSGYPGQSQAWAYPNLFIVPAQEYEGADFAEKVEAYNETVVYSPIMGFTWDSTGLEDEMTAVSNVVDKYLESVLGGVISLEEYGDKIASELEAAGMTKLTDSLTEQLQTWLAEQ